MAEYIEREAALILGYWHGERPTIDNPSPNGVDAVDSVDIEAIPAADVQPVRHGRWMYETETEMFQCSVCGGMAVRNEYPYCHWCGARMDLEADE